MKAQIIFELVLAIALISGTVLVFVVISNVLQNSLIFKFFHTRATAEIFEKYRHALYTISRRNWSTIENLSPNAIYNIYFDGSQWSIASGSATSSFDSQVMIHYFVPNNYEPNIKVITTTVEFQKLILTENFLLPKTK